MLNRRRHPDDGVPRLSRSEAVRPRSGWARLCRLSRRGTLRVLATLAIAAALAACGGDDDGVVPDFQLTDVNPNSETYNTEVSPRDYRDRISAWYFGSSTWGYCRSQFGYLNQMQAEIDSTVNAVRRPVTAAPAAALPVRILGITAIGDGTGNSTIVTGRTIPWLQDEDDWNAWESWMITYRDVVILDVENRVVGVYNLTSNDLANAANFATLKQMILDAAGE